MQTRRDYLVSQGLAKPGRGKFSREANAALDKARAEGVRFSDEVTTEVTKPTGEKVTETKAKPKGPEIAPYISPDDYRFPEAEYQAIGVDDDGKRVVYSMREACWCGYSLVNHLCDMPKVYGRPVKIVAVA